MVDELGTDVRLRSSDVHMTLPLKLRLPGVQAQEVRVSVAISVAPSLPSKHAACHTRTPSVRTDVEKATEEVSGAISSNTMTC